MTFFTNTLSFALFILFSLSAYAADVADRSVILQGYLIYTNNYLPTHETKNLTFSFQRKGCNWLIKSGVQQSSLGYSETGFDGTNEFGFTYWNDEPVEMVRAAKKKEYFVTGEIACKSIPEFDAVWSRHIWFALMPYKCGPMVALNPCDLVTGPKNLTNCNRVLFHQCDEVGSYVTEAVVWSQGNDFNEGKLSPLPPPFDVGFTNLTFVSSIKEWAIGVRAPEKFEYHTYGAIGDALTPLWSIYGVITNVTFEDNFSAQPKIFDPTYIIDTRATNYGNKQIIHYISTNGWLAPGDKEFQMLVAAGDEDKEVSKQRHFFKYVLVTIALAGLFIIFLASRKSNVA